MRDAGPASLAEIEAAIHSLSRTDLRRLEKFARWRMRALGGFWRGSDWKDLLAEAVKATLEGTRTWDKQIGFVRHLLGAMRSLSSHWAAKRERAEEEPFSVGPGDEDRGEESLASDGPEPDTQATARITLEEVESNFSDDPEVLQVIDGLRADLTGPEIQELLEISETEYWTRMRRMRRTLQRHGLRGVSHA